MRYSDVNFVRIFLDQWAGTATRYGLDGSGIESR